MFAERNFALDVSGLRVLVTAAGGGIGRVIAQRLAEAGARVHVTDIAPSALSDVLESIPDVSGSLGDAAEAESADRVVADIMSQYGGLDVLINNVGIAGPTGTIESYSDGEVERTIEVNLTSQFYLLRRCVPLLKASTRNRSIIAVASVAGRLGYAFRTPYAATKWAIIGLVKSLAIELGPQGIRANAILPGVVQGERMERVIAERAGIAGVSIEEMRSSYLSKISMRRMVEAEDVANLALFLSSDLARNISGQAISVDGNLEYL